MSLEVHINRAKNPHENEQFRRIANIIESTLNKNNLEGLLISNPCHDEYQFFMPDALLYYTDKIILFDLKDYKGRLSIPIENERYSKKPWYIYKDNSEMILVKGGSSINPFDQLYRYRRILEEIFKHYKIHEFFSKDYIYNFNVFTGPIECEAILNNIRYYRLTDEIHLSTSIEDFAGKNIYSTEISSKIINIFKSSSRYDRIESVETKCDDYDCLIDESKNEIIKFLKSDTKSILIMQSLNYKTRDSWAKYLQDHAREYGIQQAEIFAISSKMCRNIEQRSYIEPLSLYKIIYDFTNITNKNEDNNLDDDDVSIDLINQRHVPIKKKDYFEENSLIIIDDAHLLNNDRIDIDDEIVFGSGHVLTDFLNIFEKFQKIHIVFIGDPSFLSYGNPKKSAISVNMITQLADSYTISTYKDSLIYNTSCGRDMFRFEISDAISKNRFNNLKSYFDDNSLINICDNENLLQIYDNFFSKPFTCSPNCVFLISEREKCHVLNRWIHNKIQNKPCLVGPGDLLVSENTTSIQINNIDKKNIYNGLFFTVLEVLDKKYEVVSIPKKGRVPLSFTHLKVRQLHEVDSNDIFSIWILDQYLENERGKLTDDQKQALAILNNQIIKEYKFTDSTEYIQLINSEKYMNFTEEQKRIISRLISEKYHKKEKNDEDKLDSSKIKEEKKILNIYFKQFKNNILKIDYRSTCSFVRFGWAMTPQKALCFKYDICILNADTYHLSRYCDDYFRWLYTAATIGEVTYIKDFTEINPAMNAVIENYNDFIKTNNLFDFSNFEIIKKFNGFVKDLTNENVKKCATIILSELEKIGIKCKNIQSLSQYRTRINLEINEDKDQNLYIDIDNKGEKQNNQISNININNKSENHKDISNIISNIKAMAVSGVIVNSECKKSQIELEKLYKDLNIKLNEKNIYIQIAKRNNYQDVLECKHNNKSLMIQIVYNNKGFISKICVHNPEKLSFVDDIIKEMIKND